MSFEFAGNTYESSADYGQAVAHAFVDACDWDHESMRGVYAPYPGDPYQDTLGFDLGFLLNRVAEWMGRHGVDTDGIWDWYDWIHSVTDYAAQVRLSQLGLPTDRGFWPR